MASAQDEKVDTVCPVARSVDVVGDRWTILILRELYMGATRFEEMQIQTEATPQMMTTRLKALEADGMVERQPYSEKPLRYEYRLTKKGWAFYPVIYALRAWGETWCKTKGEEVAPSISCIANAVTTSGLPTYARTAANQWSARIWTPQ